MDGYTLTTKDGTRFELDAQGFVLSRSNGPKGWDYGKGWKILGFTTRHNARFIISLEDAVGGADTGQGWVHDLDHGTHRMWGSPTGRRLSSIVRTR